MEKEKQENIENEKIEEVKVDENSNESQSIEENKKDDMTFRKVENVKVKKEVKEGPVQKIFKAVLLVIAILIAIYCVFISRNILILNSIQSKARQYIDLKNYSYETTGNLTDGYTSEFKFSKKDDITRTEATYFSDTEKSFIIWRNKNENQGILVYPKQQEAIETTFEQSDFGVGNFPIQLAFAGDTIKLLAFSSIISSEEVNGKDCYVIQISQNSKKWVDKETGLVLKEEINGMTTEIVDVQIDTVKEIYKPDLTGYEVISQK
mgnify:FL=1